MRSTGRNMSWLQVWVCVSQEVKWKCSHPYSSLLAKTRYSRDIHITLTGKHGEKKSGHLRTATSDMHKNNVSENRQTKQNKKVTFYRYFRPNIFGKKPQKTRLTTEQLSADFEHCFLCVTLAVGRLQLPTRVCDGVWASCRGLMLTSSMALHSVLPAPLPPTSQIITVRCEAAAEAYPSLCVASCSLSAPSVSVFLFFFCFLVVALSRAEFESAAALVARRVAARLADAFIQPFGVFRRGNQRLLGPSVRRYL